MNFKSDMESSHKEQEVDVFSQSDVASALDRVDTVQIDNYHGLSLKVVLVYAVRAHQPFEVNRG